jgi:hypothetical protein
MKPEQYAEFLRKLEFKVVRTASSFWYTRASKFFFQNIPFHRSISPDKEEMRDFFRQSGAFAARYLTAGDVRDADKSIWICNHKDFDLSYVHKHARRGVRRGLERCEIRKLEFSWLEKPGMPLIKDTLMRQNRQESSVTDEEWNRFCSAAQSYEDVQAWAAFADGELASFIILSIIEDCAYILENYSATRFLSRYYPNNALTYAVTCEMLHERGLAAINHGLEPFEDLNSLSEFKIKMGYQRKDLVQRLEVRPAYRLLVNPLAVKAIIAVTSGSKSDYARRLNGFLRLYSDQQFSGVL